MDCRAEIAVIGGTGFYKFLDNASEVKVDTPYGAPSDLISIGTVAGRKVAFLPRHGRNHQFPPHMVNYRANIWALKELGVTRVIGRVLPEAFSLKQAGRLCHLRSVRRPYNRPEGYVLRWSEGGTYEFGGPLLPGNETDRHRVGRVSRAAVSPRGNNGDHPGPQVLDQG